MSVQEKMNVEMKRLRAHLMNASIDDYLFQYIPSGVVLCLDLNKPCSHPYPIDILYSGLRIRFQIEERRRGFLKRNLGPSSGSDTLFNFNMGNLRGYEPPKVPNFFQISSEGKTPFKTLLKELLKSKHRETRAVLDAVMMSEKAFSRLNTGQRQVTVEVLALFALALHLTTDEAYDLIANCKNLAFNSDTAGLTFCALMYSLEHHEYNTFKFTKCCFDCIRQLHNDKLPSSLRNWKNDYDRAMKQFEEDAAIDPLLSY